MPKTKSQPIDPVQHLRSFGLTYPGAHTKSPWPGHLDLAVDGKTFAFLSADGEPFSISCKLPQSSDAALLLPFVGPTGYGMGKSGWVTAKLEEGQVPPVEVFEGWLDESYRAVAPKALLRKLTAAKTARAAKAEAAKSASLSAAKSTRTIKVDAPTPSAAKPTRATPATAKRGSAKTPAATKTTRATKTETPAAAKTTRATKTKTPAAKPAKSANKKRKS